MPVITVGIINSITPYFHFCDFSAASYRAGVGGMIAVTRVVGCSITNLYSGNPHRLGTHWNLPACPMVMPVDNTLILLREESRSVMLRQVCSGESVNRANLIGVEGDVNL